MKNVLWRIYMIFLSFFCYNPALYSQEIQYDYIKEPVVLPGIQINCILKDSRGFLWFGTEQGLVKYDGYDYTMYNQVSGTQNSLSSLKINTLIEDRDQKLWIGTFQGGLNWFDPVTETFHNYFSGSNDSISFGGQDINAMELQSDGTLWIGYRNGGLDRFNPETGKIKNYQNQKDGERNVINIGVSALFFDKNENLWIGTWDEGLALLKNSEINSDWNKNLAFEDHSAFINNSKINKIFSIIEDTDGSIWLSSFKEGVFEYDQDKRQYYKLGLPENNMSSDNLNSHDMIISPGGDLICGKDALVLIKTNEINNLHKPLGNTGNNLLSSSSYSIYSMLEKSLDPVIYSLMLEGEDILWVGTDIGVYKFTRKRFETYQVTGNQNRADNITAAAQTRDKKLYVSIWNKGIYYADIQNTDIHRAIFHKLNIPVTNLNEITALAAGEDGDIWFSLMDEGIFRYNIYSKTVTSFRNVVEHQGMSDINYCITIVRGPNNSIWFGTAAGLIIYDSESAKFHFITQEPGDPVSLSNEYITAITFEGDSIAWIGTLQGGLNRGRIKSNENGRVIFEHFTYNSLDPNSLSEDHVSCIYLSSNGYLWVGTGNNGLNLYDRNNNNFRRFSGNEGLASNKIYAIQEDKNKQIWIATIAGLTKLNPDDHTFVNYSVSLNQQMIYFNKNSTFTIDNFLVFGTRENFIAFNPENITNHLPAEGVRFTQFMINNQVISPGEIFNKKVILEKALDYTDAISLAFSNNTFSIEFSLLDYLEPEKNRYFYKLDGFDTEWRQTPAQYRQADYTNLLPGDYVFRVKAVNNDGIETKTERKLNITIQPPWYKSNYAILFYIVFFTALAFFIQRITVMRLNYINEINTRKLIHEKDNEINKAKLRFFTNISHEIRTPVTLILAPLETLFSNINDENLKKQIGIILRNARKLNGLLSQLMDFRKIETGNDKLKVYQYEIKDFITDIIEDFHGPCMQKNIALEFTSAFDSAFAWFDREKIDKVLRNLLSNAVKFTPERGRIEVKTYISKENETSPEGSYWVTKVTDNGKGILPQHIKQVFERFYQVETEYTRHNPLGNGIGLSIVKEYISLHRGTIKAESVPGIETVFTIRIPKEKENYNENEILNEPVTSVIETYNSWTKIDDNPEGMLVPEKSSSDNMMTLLIAEDNAELRVFLRETLRKSFHVLEAENGKEALEIALKDIPDLVISDIMMPGMDGLELTTKLKTNIKTSHIPVILLTAKSDIADRVAGLKTGADSYIPKPFHPEHLEVRIRKLTELRNTLKRKFSQDLTIDIESMGIGSLDAEFLKKLNEVIEMNISDLDLSIEKLCQHVGMSRSNLFKKLKSLTGLAPTEYMRNTRLNKALQMLLKDRSLNISDVAYSVGFNSPAYFTACFRKVFGLPPKEFIEDFIAKKKNTENKT